MKICATVPGVHNAHKVVYAILKESLQPLHLSLELHYDVTSHCHITANCDVIIIANIY